VEGEGPVFREVLLRRVREAWGLHRSGARVRAAFDAALSQSERSKRVKVDRYGFVWPPKWNLTAVRVPTDDPDTKRSAHEFPHEELQLAVLRIVEDARGVSWDELTASVARLLGWSRRGTEIAEVLDGAVRYLIRYKKLHRNGDLLTLANGPE
ncbi:MAG: DUF3320 domain-containing protein, partial [Gammaproteobacteria bacterium]|nr:DUF3320 domain-containing protein [Gammaproteobacteria bacterium]